MIFKSDKFFRKVPKRNYYIVLLVSVLIIIASLYIRTFYLNYKMNNENNGVFFDKSINQIHKSDLNYALSETAEAILYIGDNSNKTKNMERKIYKIIENNNLNDKIIYWNISNIKENVYIKALKENFPLISDQINKAPMLIYIKDGVGVEALDSKNEFINENMLNTLLSKYGIK